MCWKLLPEWLKSLAFRLGFFYSLIFGIVSFAGIFFLNWMISSYVIHGVDLSLMEQKRELKHYAAFHDHKIIQGKFLDEANARGTSRVFYSLVSPLGEHLVSSNKHAWNGVTWDLNWLIKAKANGLIFTDLELPKTRARVLTAIIDHNRILQITQSLENETIFLTKVSTMSIILVLVMMAAGIVAGSLMAKKAISGLNKVTLAVRRISRGEFNERVDIHGTGIELVRLGRSYNRMAERIEKLIKEMQEVSDNIAHDLRSPVTRIRGLAEMAAGNTSIEKEGMETIGCIVEECDRLIHLINTMLEISEAEAGLGEMITQSIKSSELVSKTIEIFLPMAEESGLGLEALEIADFSIQGDIRKIQRIMANLVDNAIKYTPYGGNIIISAYTENQTAMFRVSDTGKGIEKDALPKIFDRFYREDLSRSLPGNGLGLSLAMAFARAHNGTIEIDSTPSKGTTSTLCLPLGNGFDSN